MISRRVTVAVIAAAGGLLTAGCSANGSTATGSTPPAAQTAVAALPSEPSDPSPAQPAKATTVPAQPAKASGSCSLLTKDQAAQLLGGAVGKTLSSGVGGGESGMKKIDGCFYKSAAAAATSVSYAVVQLSGISPSVALEAGRARMPKGAGYQQFDPALGDKSIGITGKLGAGYVAIVHVANGDRLTSVTAGGPSGSAARKIALGAAKILISG